MFSLVLNNAYVLHKKFTTKCIHHDAFIEHITEYLLKTALPNAMTKKVKYHSDHTKINTMCQLEGQHYPQHIPKSPGSKIGSKLCEACNFSKQFLKQQGITHNFKCKMTSYQCSECNIPLCIEPCFKIYHTEENYTKTLLHIRQENT